MTVEERMAAEKAIVRAAIEGLIAAGYYVAYHDGSELATYYGSTVEQIMEQCHSTDEAALRVRGGPNGNNGSVTLVFGNEGFDVIADHSIHLTSALTTATVLADAMSTIHMK